MVGCKVRLSLNVSILSHNFWFSFFLSNDSRNLNMQALTHYMNFFDFTNLRLDIAFRTLCAKLYLKAETQQLDRILVEFSRRYWENNPNTIYGSAGALYYLMYLVQLLTGVYRCGSLRRIFLIIVKHRSPCRRPVLPNVSQPIHPQYPQRNQFTNSSRRHQSLNTRVNTR